MGAGGRENLRHTGFGNDKEADSSFRGISTLENRPLSPLFPSAPLILHLALLFLHSHPLFSAAPLRHSIIHSVLSNYPPGSLLLYYSVVKECVGVFFLKCQYR